MSTFTRYFFRHRDRFEPAWDGRRRLFAQRDLDAVRGDMGPMPTRHYRTGSRRLLTGAQAARLLGISPQAFSLHALAGRIRPVPGATYSRARRPLYAEESVRRLGQDLGRADAR
jgi:hypothetical protein